MVRKRIFDLVLTIATAPFWLLVLLVASLAVLFSSGWPCFYVSRRRVDQHRTISVLKLRVMVRGADQVANRETVPVGDVRFLNLPLDSPLYTRLGRVLERFHLTELPQLLHVLTGHMSIVGNRPLPESVVELLKEVHPDVDDRFATPAGLTGPVQLIGRDNVSDARRLAIEARYCQIAASSYSMRLDISIVLSTVLIALRLKRGYTAGDVERLLGRYAAEQVELSPEATAIRHG
jgi:lipopolysaccharide/colanic/teichoic acid biosynthesis glycosyltransferase